MSGEKSAGGVRPETAPSKVARTRLALNILERLKPNYRADDVEFVLDQLKADPVSPMRIAPDGIYQGDERFNDIAQLFLEDFNMLSPKMTKALAELIGSCVDHYSKSAEPTRIAPEEPKITTVYVKGHDGGHVAAPCQILGCQYSTLEAKLAEPTRIAEVEQDLEDARFIISDARTQLRDVEQQLAEARATIARLQQEQK